VLIGKEDFMTRMLGVLVLVVAACGGGDDDPGVCSQDGGEACFQLPTAALAAHDADSAVPADIGCGAIVPRDSTIEVTVSGTVKNYSGGTPIPSAAISVYDSNDYDTPIATTTAGTDGTYSIVIPTGTPDLLFAKVVADGFVEIYVENLRPDLTTATIADFDLSMATAAFLDTTFALVDTDWDHTKAGIAAVAQDCSRHPLEHAVATISATAGERDFIAGAPVFYAAAGDFPLPVPPDTRGDTNDNGAIAALNIPPSGTAFLQIWGFPDAGAVAEGEAGLELVAEYPLNLFADEALGFTAWANQ
jgi:hypothetical protein